MATLSINVPGVAFAGRIELVLNNGTAPVHHAFLDALGVQQILDVPAGSFLRVEVSGVSAGSPASGLSWPSPHSDSGW